MAAGYELRKHCEVDTSLPHEFMTQDQRGWKEPKCGSL